jgi:glycosyltransferase 2 family protein
VKKVKSVDCDEAPMTGVGRGDAAHTAAPQSGGAVAEGRPAGGDAVRQGAGGSRVALAVTVILAGLVAAGVAWRLDWGVLSVLDDRRAWLLLGAGAAFHLLTVPFKAVAWRSVLAASLAPRPAPPIRVFLSPVMIGAALNLALAGRIGEAARVLLVHGRLARHGSPAAMPSVVGSAVTESLVATAVWVALVALAGVFFPLPALVWLVIGGIAGVWLLILLASVRGWGSAASLSAPASLLQRGMAGVRRVWGEVADGHRSLRSRAVAVPLVGASVGGWLVQLLSVYVVLLAFDVPGSWAAATLVLVGVSVAQTVPVVPGNVGVFQAAVALPLVASFGVAPTTAIAVGVVLQLVQSAPVALAGAAALSREGQGVSAICAAARDMRPRRARVAT